MPKKTLVFIYNANSGVLNAARDLIHKTVSPQTYPCKLCDITYGITGMRRLWARFIKQSEFDSVFTYRDLAPKLYPHIELGALPAIFSIEESVAQELVSADEFNRIEDIPALISLLEIKLRG